MPTYGSFTYGSATYGSGGVTVVTAASMVGTPGTGGIIDLGDPLSGLEVTVYNPAGVAENATSVVLTLTLPDGTPATPTVTAEGSGVYSAEYLPTQRGRHIAAWVATGTNASAFTEVYNVVESPPTILSLADAKTYLRLSNSSSDDEVRAVLEAVSDVCERFTKRTWRRTTFTETFSSDCSPYLHLRHSPVIGVASVVEAGVTITEYVLNKREGVLQRGTYDNPYGWLSGFEHITVTYTAGPADGVVPANILQGCRLLLQHMWQTQRGGTNTGQLGIDGEYDARLGFYLPNRVRQAWGEPRILVR